MNPVKTGLLALICIILGALLSYEFFEWDLFCLGTAPGIIVVSSSKKNIVFDEARLVYEYKVNGIKYRSSRFFLPRTSGMGGTYPSRFLPRGWGQKITTMLPAGTSVKVNYSMGFPGISCLHIYNHEFNMDALSRALNNDMLLITMVVISLKLGGFILFFVGLFLSSSLLTHGMQRDNMV